MSCLNLARRARKSGLPHYLARLLAPRAAGLAATSALAMALVAPAAPAQAIIVFDPSNYSQNILTAARTLSQINNQIQSLENEATMLINQARNLARIDFPELDAIRQTLSEIDRLMGEARGIKFQLAQVDAQFDTLFPRIFDAALRNDRRVVDARARLDTAMSAFQHSMRVQAQVVEDIAKDSQALTAIVAKSQGAQGALQAQQATNQLLALTAKQQFQLQTLIAAQSRAESMDRARRVQEEAEARGATRKFLGSGSAYPR